MLEDQNTHHHPGGVWRTPAFGSVPFGRQFIDDLRQVVEVDMPGNDQQRITQRFDLSLTRCVGKEVELDGAVSWGSAHRVIVALAGAVSVERWEFLEVPFIFPFTRMLQQTPNEISAFQTNGIESALMQVTGVTKE